MFAKTSASRFNAACCASPTMLSGLAWLWGERRTTVSSFAAISAHLCAFETSNL